MDLEITGRKSNQIVKDLIILSKQLIDPNDFSNNPDLLDLVRLLSGYLL
jgi:hypothetical protein